MKPKLPNNAGLIIGGLALISSTVASRGQEIRVLGPNNSPTGAGYYLAEKLPHELPPFCHWDLREFGNCTVPWQFQTATVPDLDSNGTANEAADATAAIDAFTAGFTQWQNVDPAQIAFNRTGAPGARSGFALDGFNLLSFVTNNTSGDDQQSIMVGRGLPNIPYITAVPGGLDSVPGGDDVGDGVNISTGPNGIAETVKHANDTYMFNIPVGQGFPNTTCITPGANAILESTPEGDDVIIGSNINTGADGICQSNANGISPLADSTLAQTALFFNPSSGVIQEADIVFNTFPAPNPRIWVLQANATAMAGTNRELRTVATHEIGHFIGLAHITGGGCHNDSLNALMEQRWCTPDGTANHLLGSKDKDDCNFLYNPDMGDAPNVDNAFSTSFSSLVRGPATGRMLNEVTLHTRWAGPYHKFSIRKRQTRNFTYEWLGIGSSSDMDSECEANITDKDEFDDGVEFVPDPPKWGEPLTIKLHVQTAVDHHGNQHNYAARPMYANLWVDFSPIDSQWSFTAPEHVIDNKPLNAAGVVEGTINLPATEKTIWLRARLTWPEPVAPCNPPLSPDLCQHEGATQFGEDEDYPLACRPVYDSIKPGEGLTFTWTKDGADMTTESWYYDYSVAGAPSVRETVTGGVDFRTQHPEADGKPVRFCFYPPREATDWRQKIIRTDGSSDVYSGNLTLPSSSFTAGDGGVIVHGAAQWEFAPLALLPDVAWRIPDLAPSTGGGTIYTSVNLSIYYSLNPQGFSSGAWEVGQTLSDLGVTIVNGQAPGVQGILWATSPFVFDPSSSIGFSPSVPGTLLNSASYPTSILIIQEHANQFAQSCVCPGDSDQSGFVELSDAALFVMRLINTTYDPCADVNTNGADDGADVQPFVGLVLAGTPCPTTPRGACCFTNGCIENVTASGCVQADGFYLGNGTNCVGVTCPQPTGACCTESSGCLNGITADDCHAMSGVYIGDSTSCGPSTCPTFTGACCTSTACTDGQTLASCAALGGAFHGIDTQCANTSCSGVTGACCREDLTCIDSTSDYQCAEQGGTYLGDGTSCGTSSCASCTPPGQDCWQTVCGSNTQFSFADNPIPAGFFDPGSQPFNGILQLGGAGGGAFGSDTVVQRMAQLCFADPLPSVGIVPIKLVYLNLIGCAPIIVQPTNEPWNVQVALSPTPAPTGTMTATKTHPNGGTFDSTFYVQPVFTFTRVSNPSDIRVLDTGLEGLPPTQLHSTDVPWLNNVPFATCSPGFAPGYSEPSPGQFCCPESCHSSFGTAPHEHCTRPPECPSCSPPGDTCSGAILIPSNASISLDNTPATTEPSDPLLSCYGGAPAQGFGTMWVRFVATHSSARISTANSLPPATDSIIALYSGTCGALSEIMCDEDGGPGFLSSMCVSGLVPGNEYYVELAAYDPPSQGPYVLDLISPCPPPCSVAGPGRSEAEACGTSNNGGCNEPTPVWRPIVCGQSMNGNVWAQSSSRDTDWYQLSLGTPTQITVTVRTQFNGVLYLADTNCSGLVILDGAFTAADCQPVSLSRCLSPGSYSIVVVPNGFNGLPCSAGPNNYRLTVSCTGSCVP